MLSSFYVFFIAVFLGVVLLLVLSSLLPSGIAGVKEWIIANLLGIVAFVLYAFGRELPPIIGYEIANAIYAAAIATVLVGYWRFFEQPVRWRWLVSGVVLLVSAIAMFHYLYDSFALRTLVVSVFQGSVCIAIGLSVMRSTRARRSRYPYLFTETMAIIIIVGHGIRAAVHLVHAKELTSLLQPSPWNLVFLSAGTLVLPVLTLGAVMMMHDTMMARAEHAANRDFLTGAWSRRAFFEAAEREIARARRTRRVPTLLLVDVDNFKRINDTQGHAAGDQVLIDLVQRAGKMIRSIDYFARIGGEEFAVLLPETDRAAALLVAERLRANVHVRSPRAMGAAVPIVAAPVPPAVSTPVPGYTISIGLAAMRDTDSFQDLMRRADSALYAAKAAGRNTVEEASG